MSVISNQADSVLKIVFSKGFDDNNKEILKTTTMAKLKNTSSHEKFYNMAKDLQLLQKHEIKKVIRHEEYELLEEME